MVSALPIYRPPDTALAGPSCTRPWVRGRDLSREGAGPSCTIGAGRGLRPRSRRFALVAYRARAEEVWLEKKGAGAPQGTNRKSPPPIISAPQSTSVAWAFALGVIGQGSLPQDLGFGLYSLNLLSPVMPQSSSIPGFAGVRNPAGGQYEGLSCLGAGGVAIGLFALVF